MGWTSEWHAGKWSVGVCFSTGSARDQCFSWLAKFSALAQPVPPPPDRSWTSEWSAEVARWEVVSGRLLQHWLRSRSVFFVVGEIFGLAQPVPPPPDRSWTSEWSAEVARWEVVSGRLLQHWLHSRSVFFVVGRVFGERLAQESATPESGTWIRASALAGVAGSREWSGGTGLGGEIDYGKPNSHVEPGSRGAILLQRSVEETYHRQSQHTCR